MSPLPRRDRLEEYAVKGAHLALRELGQAPEQRAARRLASTAPPTSGGGKRVVIVTPRSWAVHVQWEAVIGHALRARGAEVSFITCGGELEICDRVNTYEGPPVPCRGCRKYVHDSLDAHGFRRRTIREGWDDATDDAWPELDELSLAELRVVVDPGSGLPLGELVNIPVSWFLMGSELDDDALAPITYRRFLRSARRIARGLERALDEERPETVLLLNGLFLFEAIAWELCKRRGIDVVTYERGFIKETLIFRRDEPACLGDVSHLWDRWRDVVLAGEEEDRLEAYLEDRRLGRRTIDRYWSQATFDPVEQPEKGRLVALFTNLTWDSAVIGQGMAFNSIRAWLVAAIDAFAARPEHRLVIRIHPAEVKLPGKQTREPLGAFLDERYPVLPSNVTVIAADDPRSSYPLMEASDFGLVFTSTTGMELALHGKPVVVAGRTHYRGKGFTTDVAEPAEFVQALDDLLEDPSRGTPDRDLARRYAYLFFFRAPIPFRGVVEHVPGLVDLQLRDLSEVQSGTDPSLDRITGGILDGLDFCN